LVSVRGHCFELRRGLSAATEALIDPAVAGILKLIHLERSAGMHREKPYVYPESYRPGRNLIFALQTKRGRFAMMIFTPAHPMSRGPMPRNGRKP